MTDPTDAISKNGIPIRLPDERWSHIMEEYGELALMREQILLTISDPDRIFLGNFGEFMAIHEIEAGKYIVVVYRELEDDGFIITAFLTRRIRSLEKRVHIWPSSV
ncbi:MAG: hypothetical protein KF716_12045 [Anaerolineae bacterium]|nr:hypothetical protein [Anaerolineae bacterium]